MRSLASWSAALCLVLSCSLVGVGPAAADDAKLDGKWKLVLLPFGEDEFFVVTVETKDGKTNAEMVAAQAQVLGKASIKSFQGQGDSLTLVVAGAAGEDTFKGKLIADGKEAGRILGMYTFRGNNYPARLEKTEAEKPAPLGNSPLGPKLNAAMREKDAKARIEKLTALIEDFPGPRLNQVYTTILQSAEEAELTEQDLRKHIDAWLASAQPYGTAWHTDCRLAAIRALQGKEPFAKLTLALAQEADKALAKDASLEQQAGVLQSLVRATRTAGMADLAKAAEARLEKIETQLDEEYHEKVPPFKPEAFAGRDNPKHNRVVLMELFTGAQCPPCVAADVGFDGLLKSYKPTELVTLQYHLHIPGPDPLTTADSESRAEYYAVRGTPSTYFNGAQQAGGGGGMANSKDKYDQFRKVIDEELIEATSAKIDLKATRSGDKIEVTVAAETLPGDKKEEKKEDKDADSEKPKLRLRLALTEESIRYVGGNKLRFHHHVVRGLPGGVEGRELVDGRCRAKETVDLAEVRKGLDEYLGSRTFPNALPEIEFKGLALVAFVQDDADKRVLHVVSIPIPDAK